MKLIINCLIALCVTFALAGGVAHAQKKEAKRDVKAGMLRERSYKRLNNIYQEIGDEKYVEALDGLNNLWEQTERYEYERAVIAQAIGHVKSAQEKYGEAIKYFKIALELDKLPNLQHYQIMFGVAQLYAVQSQFEESIRWLLKWFDEVDVEPKAEAYVLLGNAYAQLGNFVKAIEALETAVAKSDDPKENWYQLLMAMHFELKHYEKAGYYLEILVQMNPDKKDYWVQLSSVYVTLKKDEKALATLALAHRRGLLDKESDWKQLSNLYAYLEVPLKAAQVLQEGLEKKIIEPSLKEWEAAGNFWYAAQNLDKALNAFAEAAKYAEDGKIDLRRGYILVDQERWAEAIDALDAAIKKGGIKDNDKGNAHLLMGMARFEQGELDQAEEAFSRARRFEKSKNAARQWLNHLQEERKKIRQAA